MSCKRIERVYRVKLTGEPSLRELTDELLHAAKAMHQYGAVDISVDCDSTVAEHREVSLTMRDVTRGVDEQEV